MISLWDSTVSDLTFTESNVWSSESNKLGLRKPVGVPLNCQFEPHFKCIMHASPFCLLPLPILLNNLFILLAKRGLAFYKAFFIQHVKEFKSFFELKQFLNFIQISVGRMKIWISDFSLFSNEWKAGGCFQIAIKPSQCQSVSTKL